MPDDEWVEFLRVHDRLEAEITVRFLEDHGVAVQTAGGANTAIPTMGLTDVRILVPSDQAERAAQVLSAMREDTSKHPFRDAPAEPYDAPVATRKAAFAVMLALLVPIGAGHFYARHGAAGTILALGILGGFLASMLGWPSLIYMCGLLVIVDAVFAPLAVRRTNRGHVSSEPRQRAWAFAAVVAAWVLALVFVKAMG
jgi:hypothetical protein